MSRPPRQPKREGPPPEFPPINPPYSFDLSSYVETVMELQRSMAQITERVSFLTDQAKANETKLNEVRDTVRSARTALYVIGVVLTIVGGFLAWFVNRAVDTTLLYLQSLPK